MPSGEFLMEDFYYAGGLPAVLREMGENGLLHKDALTVNGRTIWDNVHDAECFDHSVTHAFGEPFRDQGGIVVLRGNLAPQGAVLKPSAASPELMQHRGRAVVFETIADYNARIDDPDLDIDESYVMVLKNCGPKGYPGMAEVGNMALVEDGDQIELDLAGGRLHLDVPDDELERRKAEWTPPAPHFPRGYVNLYVKHVLQADEGCDLDFLVVSSGAPVARDIH